MNQFRETIRSFMKEEISDSNKIFTAIVKNINTIQLTSGFLDGILNMIRGQLQLSIATIDIAIDNEIEKEYYEVPVPNYILSGTTTKGIQVGDYVSVVFPDGDFMNPVIVSLMKTDDPTGTGNAQGIPDIPVMSNINYDATKDGNNSNIALPFIDEKAEIEFMKQNNIKLDPLSQTQFQMRSSLESDGTLDKIRGKILNNSTMQVVTPSDRHVYTGTKEFVNNFINRMNAGPEIAPNKSTSIPKINISDDSPLSKNPLFKQGG